MKKITINIIAVLVIVAGFVGEAQAQQLSIFNQNIANPFTINPSAAGIDGNKIFLHHRKQWVGVDGAPQFSMLTSEWRLGTSRSGVGLSLSSDKSGVIQNTGAFVTYASHFNISKKQALSFGLSTGVKQSSIAFGDVRSFDEQDPILFSQDQNSTHFDFNAGLTYKAAGLTVQVAGLQLLGNTSSYNNTFVGKQIDFQHVRHYFGSIGYDFFTKSNIAISPIVQARGIEGLPFQPEGILKVDFKDQFWTALNYRHESAYGVMAGVNINKSFMVGYSFELSQGDFAKYNNGTHELTFGVNLGGAYQALKNQRNLDKVAKTASGYDERLEYMKRENEKMKAEIDAQKVVIEDLKDKVKEIDYDELKRMLLEAKNYSNTAPKATTAIKESKEKFELNKVNTPTRSNYLVIATSKRKSDAFKAVSKAKKLYDIEAFVIKTNQSKKYYVVTEGFNNVKTGVQAKKLLMKKGTSKTFNGSPWVLNLEK